MVSQARRRRAFSTEIMVLGCPERSHLVEILQGCCDFVYFSDKNVRTVQVPVPPLFAWRSCLSSIIVPDIRVGELDAFTFRTAVSYARFERELPAGIRNCGNSFRMRSLQAKKRYTALEDRPLLWLSFRLFTLFLPIGFDFLTHCIKKYRCTGSNSHILRSENDVGGT